MRWIIISLLHGYKQYISPWLPSSCRFTPTCSEYMSEACQRFGAMHGVRLGVARLCRCHPLHPGGHDPVPYRHGW